MSGAKLLAAALVVAVPLLALPVAARADWTSTVSGSDVTMTKTGTDFEELRIRPADGDPGVLQHNRPSEEGYATATDFDSGPGTATAPNDPATQLAVVGGSETDWLRLGEDAPGRIARSIAVEVTFDAAGGADPTPAKVRWRIEE